MNIQLLQLKKREERRLLQGHLWIYSNEIDTKRNPLKQFSPGEQVYVQSDKGKILGTAYINPHSLLCARLVSRNKELLSYELILRRIQQALALRQDLFPYPFYRLVYGESDLLPGLVIDRFDSHLVVQINTMGMEKFCTETLDALQKLLQPDSILLKNDSSMRLTEGLEQTVSAARGNPPDEVQLVENGVRFLAPLRGGQKTGWFYDQRYNRAELNKHVRGKRVLDVFSYIGSFGVQAAVSGAAQVWCVDGSRTALESARINAAANGVEDRVNCTRGDAFEVLRGLYEQGESFDVVIVDPPAFIKRKKDHRKGLQAYHRINALAMQLLNSNGLLLAASCSMHLQTGELRNLLRINGQNMGRHVQILFEGTQAPDHPVHPAIAETRYLKAFMCRALHPDKVL